MTMLHNFIVCLARDWELMVVAPNKNLKGTVTAGCDVEIMKDPLKERIEGGRARFPGVL